MSDNDPQPTIPENDRLVDFAEVAQLLGGVSERSVRRLISKGELPPPVKVLSSPRLYLSDVLNYFDRLKIKREKIFGTAIQGV